MAIKKLPEKEDKLQNAKEFLRAGHAALPPIANTCGIINLKFHWVPGHINLLPNEKAVTNTKKAAKRYPSPDNIPPKILRKALSSSIVAICQKKTMQIQHKWLDDAKPHQDT